MSQLNIKECKSTQPERMKEDNNNRYAVLSRIKDQLKELQRKKPTIEDIFITEQSRQ